LKCMNIPRQVLGGGPDEIHWSYQSGKNIQAFQRKS